MKFDKRLDPTLCCASGDSRYAVHGVGVIRPAGGRFYLAATDGHALTMIAAEGDDSDTTGIYPTEAFKEARRLCSRKGTDALLALNGKATTIAGVSYPAIDQRFPDVLGIIPQGHPEYVVTLNAALLARIQKAIGCGAVELRFHGKGTPIVVRPSQIKGAERACPDSYGAMMPCG